MTNMISWLFSTEKTLHIIFNLVLILLEWWVLHAFRSTCFLISICMGLACLDDQALTGNIQVFQFVWSLSRSWVSLLGSPTVMLPVISRRKQHVRSNMWTSSSISHTHKAARCLEPALLTGCCCQLCFALLDTKITQERKCWKNWYIKNRLLLMNWEKEQRTKNEEQRTKSLQLKEQGAENVSVGYCHLQCFIYRRKQTLQKNETLKKRTSYVLLYQRSCITS